MIKYKLSFKTILIIILLITNITSCSSNRAIKEKEYNNSYNANYIYQPHYPAHYPRNIYARVPERYGNYYDYDSYYQPPKYYYVNNDNYAPIDEYGADKEKREWLILPTLSISLVIGLIIWGFIGF